jgi:hypothetical protein
VLAPAAEAGQQESGEGGGGATIEHHQLKKTYDSSNWIKGGWSHSLSAAKNV